eukprot:TRINITY_DN95393_c0_g1_i1.p1 TRINITY_DN95393_c0_g1~~TRINITY_DN95393_c0_g1_i1.p1  ORF type:complete len:389 (-),score=60.02 TRINITY_DN95393_c0_g1_i1:140-1306(-)
MHLINIRGCVLSAICLACDAWDRTGHEHIARMADAYLDPKERDQVKTLMKGALEDYAGWEDNMTKKHPSAAVIHWHRQSPEWSCKDSSRPEVATLRCKDATSKGVFEEDDSLFCALAYLFEHFAHDALLQEYPKPREPINAPKQLKALEKVYKASKSYSSSYLRWLVILLGDLHQPLHWLREHDYGQKVMVEVDKKSMSLLDFWEVELPRRIVERDAELAKSHLKSASPPKYYSSIPVFTTAQLMENVKARKDTQPAVLFRDWGKAASMDVCNEIYAAIGQRDTLNPIVIDAELAQKWQNYVEKTMRAAGERIAYVLRDILVHRQHMLHAKQGRGIFHHKVSPWKNFCYNLVIGVILVPMVLVALAWHAANAGAMRFSLRATSASKSS